MYESKCELCDRPKKSNKKKCCSVACHHIYMHMRRNLDNNLRITWLKILLEKCYGETYKYKCYKNSLDWDMIIDVLETIGASYSIEQTKQHNTYIIEYEKYRIEQFLNNIKEFNHKEKL